MSALCAPYRRRVKLVATLDTKEVSGSCWVSGVAELNDNVYVVVFDSNTVNVFERKSSYNRLEDIVIKEMKNPRDMAADFTRGHLFIADGEGQCVWRVEINDKANDERCPWNKVNGHEDGGVEMMKAVKWADVKGVPRSVSVTATGDVLVLVNDSNCKELTVFDNEGKNVGTFSLKSTALRDPLHVIPTSIDKFLVCHGDCISLVDRKMKS